MRRNWTVAGTGLYYLPAPHAPAPLVAFLPLACAVLSILLVLRLLRQK